MEELMKYFRDSARKFGSPEVVEVGKSETFDLRWNTTPPLSLRWTWADPMDLRRDPSERFFLGAAISGAGDHDAHVELADPSHVWLFVSKRYKEFPGKVEKTKILRCLTKEGEWLKKALKAGTNFLAKLG
jgi:hypothetical protein